MDDQELRFLAGNQYMLSNIPVTEITEDGDVIAPVAPENLCMPLFIKEKVAGFLRDNIEDKIILQDFSDWPVSAGICRTENGRVFLFGPILYNSVSKPQLYEIQRLLKKEKHVGWIRKSTYKKLTAVMADFMYALERYCWHPKEQLSEDEEEVAALNKELVGYMTADEETMTRSGYVDEQYVLNTLKSGNVQEMQKIMGTFHVDYSQVGENAAKKTDEYMAVAMVGIISRAAIESGVVFSESFRLSDVYLRKIARCTTQKEILEIRNQAFVEFTKLVRTANLNYKENRHIEDCKKDIASRIFQKISLEDIAKDLGMQKNYLARLFSASEGITVGQYIRKEKMKKAKNMLIYSDYTVTDIAAYLSYESLSYFGKQFLAETGMTPKAYRNKYHTAEF